MLSSETILSDVAQPHAGIHHHLEASLSGDSTEMVIFALETILMDRRHVESRHAAHLTFIGRRNLRERLDDLALDEHETSSGVINLDRLLELVQIFNQLPALPGSEPLFVLFFHGVTTDADVSLKIPDLAHILRFKENVSVDPHHVGVF